ncbi:unnamed protein product [Polarella glacialis]|uniref:Sterol 3-beta-glucosyltransferase n=1 Tax=Polarella glacialis TaxID=89957 RepID=A0A813L9W2_POLGL|nr:unnamed protein product [Polarella glacialis]
MSAQDAQEVHGVEKLKVWISSCVDLPPYPQGVFGGLLQCFWEAKPVTVCVRAREIPPDGLRDLEPQEPSTRFFVGLQDDAGHVTFQLAGNTPGLTTSSEQGDSLQLRLLPGWRLRLEIVRAGCCICSGLETTSSGHGQRGREGAPFADLQTLAFAEIETEDLARRQSWQLLLSEPVAHEALYRSPGVPNRASSCGSRARSDAPIQMPQAASLEARRPAFLKVRTELASGGQRAAPLAGGHQFSGRRPRDPERKRVMLLTRGTRGDVQPFVALARGLALAHNCEVIIVTELCFKQFVKDARAGLPEGSLRYLPSGGNTLRKMNRLYTRLALRASERHDLMQALIFSRSEVEWFASEGCFFHWAWQENPDFIVFGFTVTHAAMILSEALQIPIVGFVLQPAQEIPMRGHMANVIDEFLGPGRRILTSPSFTAVLQQLWERCEGRLSLNYLRSSRGLAPAPRDIRDYRLHLNLLKEEGIPMISPINPMVLGLAMAAPGQQGAGSWSPTTSEESCYWPGLTFTDFIFLRLQEDDLDAEVQAFILHARAACRKIVAISFSSMPVGERRVLQIAMEICHGCMPPVALEAERHRPAVIVLIGGQCHDPAPAASWAEADHLQEQGRLLVLRRGVPFGALFPAVDAVLLHGGLGVTSEALQAGTPIICSGPQIMDQRFWAERVAALGCGPKGVPTYGLLSRPSRSERPYVVQLVDKALDQRSHPESFEGQSWFQRAGCVRESMREMCAGDLDGVNRNAKAVFEAGTIQAKAVTEAYKASGGSCWSCWRTLCRQLGCVAAAFMGFWRWLCCILLPTLLWLFIRLLKWLLLCGPLRSFFQTCCRERRVGAPCLDQPGSPCSQSNPLA